MIDAPSAVFGYFLAFFMMLIATATSHDPGDPDGI